MIRDFFNAPGAGWFVVMVVWLIAAVAFIWQVTA